ncbi:MAG: flagellar biosynthesis protein FlhB [Nitrospirae bacterium]|nr:flagellar biosynthesis protein FlhB [Nitrospirota bacterium]
MADSDEKTQEATPRRRQKAKEKGQIARSRELTSFVALGGMLSVLYFGGAGLLQSFMLMTKKLLGMQYGTNGLEVFRTASSEALVLILPMLGVAFMLSILTSIVQGGFFIKNFEPEFNKVNPGEGIKRIFSKNGLVEFIKSLMKFVIGGLLFYYVIKNSITDYPELMTLEINQIVTKSGDMIIRSLFYSFLVFFVIAFIGYLLDVWRFEQSIMMSLQEIKEETKESEGDPVVKSRIRMIQRELSKKRMMQEVPQATVIVTNPTHLAVALKYQDKVMHAPQIIAKGADHIAEKIREIAREHNIPIVEDKPLARILFRLEIKDFVPADLYKAVAKILAHVYKIKGKL